jgi:hypothetical protein
MLLSILRSSLRVSSSVVLILFLSRFFGDGRAGGTLVEAFAMVASKRYYKHPQFASLTLPSSTGGRRSLVGCWQEKKPTEDKDDNEDDQEEEEGWGFDVDDELVAQAEQELLVATTTTTTTDETATKTRERDWFIPVFALVSIAGFAGLYTYELLRLYFAGELYLPFLH